MEINLGCSAFDSTLFHSSWEKMLPRPTTSAWKRLETQHLAHFYNSNTEKFEVADSTIPLLELFKRPPSFWRYTFDLVELIVLKQNIKETQLSEVDQRWCHQFSIALSLPKLSVENFSEDTMGLALLYQWATVLCPKLWSKWRLAFDKQNIEHAESIQLDIAEKKLHRLWISVMAYAQQAEQASIEPIASFMLEQNNLEINEATDEAINKESIKETNEESNE